MRIGIVTQPLQNNYGGLLQNYALQQVLKSMGHTPITLDFMAGYSGVCYVYQAAKLLARVVLGRAGAFTLKCKPDRISNEQIDEFIGRNISLTRKFWNRYPSSIIKNYGLDAVIVGSDQVWRPIYNISLKDMYLDFCKDKKIKKMAYAASFGTSEWEYTEAQQGECSELLKHFDAVSVREKSGLKLLEKLERRDGIQVLDPTVLLGREGFDTLLSNCPDSTETIDYLGSYILDDEEGINDRLEGIREKHHLDSVKKFQTNTAGMGPAEWIRSIKNSKLFITDSFHGTVFCLLYHVPFMTVVNTERGADRFYSLLEPLGLTSRIVDNISEIDEIYEDIDWESVDGKLQFMRSESLGFLRNSLKD